MTYKSKLRSSRKKQCNKILWWVSTILQTLTYGPSKIFCKVFHLSSISVHQCLSISMSYWCRLKWKCSVLHLLTISKLFWNWAHQKSSSVLSSYQFGRYYFNEHEYQLLYKLIAFPHNSFNLLNKQATSSPRLHHKSTNSIWRDLPRYDRAVPFYPSRSFSCNFSVAFFSPAGINWN